MPKHAGDAVTGMLKRDANRLIELFHDGIKYDDFNLEQLSDETVQRKDAKNYQFPNSPLYGAGDDQEPNSYANMLRIKELGNGWKIYPSKARHHDSNISLEGLFRIHEFGAKIVTQSGAVIQIPPRPALLLAFKALLVERRKNKKETSRDVKKAIAERINNAESKYLDNFIQFKGNKDNVE